MSSEKTPSGSDEQNSQPQDEINNILKKVRGLTHRDTFGATGGTGDGVDLDDLDPKRIDEEQKIFSEDELSPEQQRIMNTKPPKRKPFFDNEDPRISDNQEGSDEKS